VDFYQIKETSSKNGVLIIYPDFKVCRSKDLMVRGKSFYAIWDEEKGLWSTDEYDVQRIVDTDLAAYREKAQMRTDGVVQAKMMSDFSSNSWVEFRSYLGHVSDNSHQLDEKLTFLNTEVKKKDYVSKRLNYPLEGGKYDGFDELIGTLYDPEERAKLEWAIGAIISGDAKDIQKFIVLYGEHGAGKSTILHIIEKLFQGYYTAFEAKALTSSSNAFSTEVFKTNPLVAIQHDGDLSKIEDNSKLNSIVSHEEMTMNEKYKPSYTSRVNAFLFMGTNKPVKITDAKSGIIRRLIDVKPSGRKLSPKKYQAIMSQIDFELGAIASHCLKVYREMGKNYYSTYRPLEMMLQTDVFFNFVESYYDVFRGQDGVTLSQGYDMYKTYCDEALVEFKYPRHKFREELKNYFTSFSDIIRVDGVQKRSYYSGFLYSKFSPLTEPKKEEHQTSLILDCTKSIFDEIYSDSIAQYSETTSTGTVKPINRWIDVKTKLSDIDTREVHYVKLPEVNHIVADFDLKDENGNKSLEKNIEAASKWPATYAEFSKSGAGIHLHYLYDGDVNKLSSVYSEGIEIKVFSGNSSLRRKLTKCNNIPIAIINSGLPLKGDKMINFDSVTNEKALRTLIKRNLNKEIHPGTKPSIDFINKILDDAYNSGLHYDITDMRPAILAFANNSSNQSDYCIKLVGKMKFKSEEPSIVISTNKYDKEELVFFDVEVFPNLFVVVWKPKGKPTVKMINPTASDIESLLKFRLIGYNCRRYDNHIMYARYIGYDNKQLYDLSQRIINGSANAMFSEAYNLSYTDVYDFASAANKKSLKKFEIELGIHHQELGLPWDKPVDEKMWPTVADYCVNDVVATEAVFDHLSADWIARQILSELSGLSVNDTTNQHTIKIVFGDNKHPQDKLVYTDLSKMFLGYKFENGKSSYRDVNPDNPDPRKREVGEGGYVEAKPNMYVNVALLDIASMHPTSTEQLNLLGPYTKNYSDLKKARISIKHEDYESLNTLLDGKLIPFIKKVEEGLYTIDDLSNALKTPINSAYGLTSAKFDNPFRDPRNIDNIVAKRGALFMIDLRHAVEEQGFTVAHIKTDSIKIPDATPYIIQFIMDFGKKYGYDFEHEATYDKMCLVNDAVYIAKYSSKELCESLYGYAPKGNRKHSGEWTATGAQFAQPYVFKTLFSKEPIIFEDLCETKSVTSSLYLDMNESLKDVSDLEKEYEKIQKDIVSGKADASRVNILNSRLIKLRDSINEGHEYHFIGKVGSFCPIKPGKGGGILLREKDGKYYAATGSKGYRWLEAEMVKTLGKQDDIDRAYYGALVDDALANMSKYGDIEWFISDDSTNVPPWMMECGLYENCMECPNWLENKDKGNTCKLGYDCVPF
jgi:energy-coupling factor transporter ATP-binding protein EcfA2